MYYSKHLFSLLFLTISAIHLIECKPRRQEGPQLIPLRAIKSVAVAVPQTPPAPQFYLVPLTGSANTGTESGNEGNTSHETHSGHKKKKKKKKKCPHHKKKDHGDDPANEGEGEADDYDYDQEHADHLSSHLGSGFGPSNSQNTGQLRPVIREHYKVGYVEHLNNDEPETHSHDY